MRRQWKFVMKLLWSAFIALNVWLYRVSGGRMMGKMGARRSFWLRRRDASQDARARPPSCIWRRAAVS